MVSSKSLIFLSDLHCMSQYAITSPKIHKQRLKFPSVPRKLYQAWKACLDARKQKTHLLFLNGEPVDGPGEKERGTELWSTEIQDGIDDAYELFQNRSQITRHLVIYDLIRSSIL